MELGGEIEKLQYVKSRILKVEIEFNASLSTDYTVVYGANPDDRIQGLGDFHSELEGFLKKTSNDLIILEDMNLTVGNQVKIYSPIIGQYGEIAENYWSSKRIMN